MTTTVPVPGKRYRVSYEAEYVDAFSDGEHLVRAHGVNMLVPADATFEPVPEPMEDGWWEWRDITFGLLIARRENGTWFKTGLIDLLTKLTDDVMRARGARYIGPAGGAR